MVKMEHTAVVSWPGHECKTSNHLLPSISQGAVVGLVADFLRRDGIITIIHHHISPLALLGPL